MMEICFRSRVLILFRQKYFALCQSKLIYKYQVSFDVYFEHITMSDLFYNFFKEEAKLKAIGICIIILFLSFFLNSSFYN